MNLKRKRLLLLGGGSWKNVLKGFADHTGVELIATGNDKSGGIFEIAKEGYEINSTDKIAMKDLIVSKNIDGVYMGGSEAVISSACEYINEHDMPCYCNKKQWNFIQDKSKLKEKFKEYNLPVVERYKLTYGEIDAYSDKIPFPVITKPTDGCGSSGFSICNNAEELKRGYKLAQKNSQSGEVMIEKFVKNKGVVVFYTFTEGKMVFSGMEDKYPMKYVENGSFVAGMHVFESRYACEFRQKFDDKLSAMFESIGIKEGTIWFEVFHDGDNYYFNEAGYRYSGAITVYPVDYFYNINQVYSDMYYALTGKSQIYGWPSIIPDSKRGKKHYAIYPIYVKAGKIKKIYGLEAINELPNVVTLIQYKGLEYEVKASGDFSQNFAMVHFVFDTKEEFKETITQINNHLSVLDDNDSNMIILHERDFFDSIEI